MGITCVFLSNPHNPTGQVIYGDELKRMVEIARKGTTMILDEVSKRSRAVAHLRRR